jgi:hypothetical protein
MGGGPNVASVGGGQASFALEGEDGVFELLIPLEALPMASQSPVTAALVVVHAKGKPKGGPPSQVTFGDGVSFGKRAALRKLALEEWHTNILEGAAAVGYRLGDDLHWTLAQRAPGWLSYQRRDELLLEVLTNHNGATVGTLFAGLRRLACIAADGSVLGFEPDLRGSVVETVKRGEDLHIFNYDSYPDEMGRQGSQLACLPH